MVLAHSRVTSQSQISVPAVVRRRLGLAPGSVLEWDEENGTVTVRRAGRYSSEDVHRAVFAKRRPSPKSVEELKLGARRYMKSRHARG